MPTEVNDTYDQALDIAAELQLDLLLENQYTSSPTIRFICAARKALLECPADALTPEMARAEQLVNRLYERLGHDRRTVAYEDSERYKAKGI